MATDIEAYRANVERQKNTLAWERNLQPGDVVIACWTNSYTAYSCRAEVVRVNKSSIRMRLLDEIRYKDELLYEKGRSWSLPRIYNPRWSNSNRIAPYEEAA